ncbi:hypothetical protein AUEXF2481DRAFT_484821 [Aureobasidium subglaciale EXF-2481]|uniref:Uncharacterized protein n=1 Tax=Aureobasidium subglaciale (strain EXF-2481) TaxID=1043005 RepID=A0A074YQH6_AURSE|nr:uncharacterized protein AUEXF2481DRAFT_484821 [Aureobasidium subglaciale EXF-2481]KEQ98429.1 hypothetical protein AUEXF2481DRAFT_484821 [Aureobasidium subglaciale EXF-2481]
MFRPEKQSLQTRGREACCIQDIQIAWLDARFVKLPRPPASRPLSKPKHVASAISVNDSRLRNSGLHAYIALIYLLLALLSCQPQSINHIFHSSVRPETMAVDHRFCGKLAR